METKKKQTAENFIKEIRRKSKRIFSSEQKINIVMEAIRAEMPVAELCRNLKHYLVKSSNYFDDIHLDPSITVNVDAPLVEQVLINLIINAIDAVKEVAVPKISINVTNENNGRVSVRIIDNGTGIEKEILDKIFIPFFSTKKLGSGIGLNLCKQIMMLHKGTINVESTPGNGSVFTLAFLG